MIVYGKGVNAIAEDLKVSKEKAQEIKDAVLKAFPDLANYLENVIKFLKDKGYVENYFGVRRRLPEIYLPPYEFEFNNKFDKNSKEYYQKLYLNKLNNTFDWNRKNEIIEEARTHGIKTIQNGAKIAEAIRRAYNAPVQSTASYITKQAMINIDTNEILKELDVHLEFSIHDELGVSVPIENAYEAMKIVEEEFLNGGRVLPMRMKCDIAISDCWDGDTLVFDENNKLVKKGQ